MLGTMDAGEPAVRKGPWTLEEDHILVNYVSAHGEGAWNNLARAAGLNRTGKSCRLRWLNYLSPSVRRGNFTLDEHDLIVRLQATWGNKWSRIAKHLPGRTDNEVKNFWRTKLQRKQRGSCSEAAGGACLRSTPAVAEGQGSSDSAAGWAGFVTRDYGTVEQRPSVVLSSSASCLGHQGYCYGAGVHGGGGTAGSGSSSTSAAAAMDLFPPEVLAAAPGDNSNIWAVDDFWFAVHSYHSHGNS